MSLLLHFVSTRWGTMRRARIVPNYTAVRGGLALPPLYMCMYVADDCLVTLQTQARSMYLLYVHVSQLACASGTTAGR